MFYFYIVLSIILSLCIIVLCLLQNSQKDNASGIAFSNSTFQEVIGITETKNTISRLTLLFIFILFFLCILAYRDKSRNLEIPDIDYSKLKEHEQDDNIMDIEDNNTKGSDNNNDNTKGSDNNNDNTKGSDNNNDNTKVSDNNNVNDTSDIKDSKKILDNKEDNVV